MLQDCETLQCRPSVPPRHTTISLLSPGETPGAEAALLDCFILETKFTGDIGVGWGGVEGWGENADNCN